MTEQVTPATDKQVGISRFGGQMSERANDEFVKAMASYTHDTDIQRLVARIEADRAKIAALEADVEWHRMGRDECRKENASLRERLQVA